MYLCYVDESGDPGKAGSKHLVLGAAIVFEGVWLHVRAAIEHLLTSAFPPPMTAPPELHLSEIRKGRGAYGQLPVASRQKLFADYCQLVGNFLAKEVSFIAVGANKGRWSARHPGKSGYDLYGALFEQLASRFDLYLRRRHAEDEPSKGMVIVDEHSTNLSKSLRLQYGQFQRLGTQWSPTYNLIENAMFLASHESPGLQLADLCSYSAFRLLESGDRSIVDQVQSVFDREPMTAARNPGKWHGVKFLELESSVEALVRKVWL